MWKRLSVHVMTSPWILRRPRVCDDVIGCMWLPHRACDDVTVYFISFPCMWWGHRACDEVTMYVLTSPCMWWRHRVCDDVPVHMSTSPCMWWRHWLYLMTYCACDDVTVYVLTSLCMWWHHRACHRLHVFVNATTYILWSIAVLGLFTKTANTLILVRLHLMLTNQLCTHWGTYINNS